MSWKGINEFVAVAATQSFTLASKNLKISTAQVSRQVSALEKRLNIKLFYRSTRKVSLTQEGKLFYKDCKNVLEGLKAAEEALSNLQQQISGSIRLSAPITFGEQKIQPILNDFIQLYPQIEIISELSNQRIDLVAGGFDLAIRLGQLESSNLLAKKLAIRSTYVCASPSYIEKFGVPHSISELSAHNCLLGTRDLWHFNEQGKEKNVRVKGNIRCNSGIGLVDAAIKGIGLIQLANDYVDEHIKSGQLIRVLDSVRPEDEGIWALYPGNRYVSPKIRLLIAFLSDNLE